MDFKAYTHKKEILRNNLLKLQTILKELDLINLFNKINQDIDILQNEKFTLVVVGEFSRGKSTFVNALLGKKILPSSKRPTTNIISKIVFADEPVYEIFFKDGKSRYLTEEEFKNIKAQAEVDSSNILKFKSFLQREEDFSKIDCAVIGQPISFCKNGVEVVDTPGTNDLNVGRMEITYNYLNQADAAVLLLNSTQVLTKSELDFLKERILGNQIKDIFVVINFKDQLNSEEEVKVKDYVYTKLKELVQIDPKIFLVSSSGALCYRIKQAGGKLTAREIMNLPDSFSDTGFSDLENALANYLDEEKGKAKLGKYIERIFIYIKSAENDINLRTEALARSTKELKNEISVLQPKVEKIKCATAIIVNNMKQQLSLSEIDLKTYVDGTVKNMRLAALKAVDNYQEGMSKNEIEQLIDSAVTPLQKELFENVNKKLNEAINAELEVALKNLKNIWNDFNLDKHNLFLENLSVITLDVNTGKTDDEIRFNSKKTLYAVGAYLLAGLSGIGGVAVIGAAILGWFFGKSEEENEQREKIKNQIRNQYDVKYKNFSVNICKEYHTSVDKICRKVQSEVNSYLDDIEKQLQEVILLKEKDEKEIEKQKQLLTNQLGELQNIQNAVEEVLRI